MFIEWEIQTEEILQIDMKDWWSWKMTSALMSQKSNYYPGQKVVVYKYRSWSAY